MTLDKSRIIDYTYSTDAKKSSDLQEREETAMAVRKGMCMMCGSARFSAAQS